MKLPDFLTQGTLGEIRLTGHRIDLMFVVDCCREGFTPEKIHEEYPSLPLPLILKVLDFYRDNRAEVDDYVRKCHEEIDRYEASYRPGPGILRMRRLQELLERADAEHAGDAEWASLPILEKVRRIEQAMAPEKA
jgi:uncharacterized protein (DUF433 family)